MWTWTAESRKGSDRATGTQGWVNLMYNILYIIWILLVYIHHVSFFKLKKGRNKEKKRNTAYNKHMDMLVLLHYFTSSNNIDRFELILKIAQNPGLSSYSMLSSIWLNRFMIAKISTTLIISRYCCVWISAVNIERATKIKSNRTNQCWLKFDMFFCFFLHHSVRIHLSTRVFI